MQGPSGDLVHGAAFHRSLRPAAAAARAVQGRGCRDADARHPYPEYRQHRPAQAQTLRKGRRVQQLYLVVSIAFPAESGVRRAGDPHPPTCWRSTATPALEVAVDVHVAISCLTSAFASSPRRSHRRRAASAPTIFSKAVLVPPLPAAQLTAVAARCPKPTRLRFRPAHCGAPLCQMQGGDQSRYSRQPHDARHRRCWSPLGLGRVCWKVRRRSVPAVRVRPARHLPYSRFNADRPPPARFKCPNPRRRLPQAMRA